MTDDLNGYVSPINMIITQTRCQVEEQQGQILMRAVHEAGFDVDQHELMRALKYDREQYKKGYEDAMKNAVPLDKLCEWLARNAFAFECEDCEEYCKALLDCEHEVGSDQEYWKNKLTKWMEEQDAAD